MKKNQINVELDQEYLIKLKVLGYNDKLKENIKQIIQEKIQDEYDKTIANSEGYTVKELLAKEILKIKAYNEANFNYSISQADLENIKNGNIQEAIKGTIVNCPIADDIVMKHKVEKNIKIHRYITTTGQWKIVDSYNLHIETNKGKFVYISALNTIKTLKNYEEYLKKERTRY